MEDSKNKVLLTVVIAITLLVALVGATFAYFSATSTSAEQTVTTSSMNLLVSVEGSTHITDIAPTTFDYSTVAENKNVAKIPFKVTGSSSQAGTYTINLNNNIQLKDTLADGTPLTGGELADLKYQLYTADGQKVLDETDYSTASFDLIEDHEIVAGDIDDSYVLYVYIKDNGGDQNKFQENDFTITLSGSAKQA